MHPNQRMRNSQQPTLSIEKTKHIKIAKRLGNQRSSQSTSETTPLAAAHAITSIVSSPSTKREIFHILYTFLQQNLQTVGLAYICQSAPEELVVESGLGTWLNFAGLCFAPDNGTISQVIQKKEIRQGRLSPFEQPSAVGASEQIDNFSVCFPVNIEQQTLGAVWIERNLPFSSEETLLAKQICEIAVSSIHHHTFMEEKRTSFDRIAAINRLNHRLTEAESLENLSEQFAQFLYELLPDVEAVLISRIERRTETIRYIYAGTRKRVLAENELPLMPLSQFDQELQRRIMTSAKSILISDLPEVTDAAILTSIPSAPGHSALYIPMHSNNKITGILQLQGNHIERLTAEGQELLNVVANMGAIAIETLIIVQETRQKETDWEQTYERMVDSWVRMLSIRDSETEEHTRRVCNLTIKMAKSIGCAEKDLVDIRRGSLLHDIGKVGIPDDILHKTGALNDDEWRIMRQHPVYAYQLLSPIPYLRSALDIPYCHHEKWDGSGYPRGLKGEEIPLSARVFAVADVWDALTSYRPYRPAWTEEKAMNYLIEQSGISFDPRVIKVFLHCHLGVSPSTLSKTSSLNTQPLSFFYQCPASVYPETPGFA